MATSRREGVSASINTTALFAGLAAALLVLGLVVSIGMSGSDDSVAVLESVPPATPDSMGTPSGTGPDGDSDSATMPRSESSEPVPSPTDESAPSGKSGNGVESFTLDEVQRVEVRLRAPGDLVVEHTSTATSAEVKVAKTDESVVVDVNADQGTLHVATRCELDDDHECKAQVTLSVAPGTFLDLYTALGDVSVTEADADLRARSDVGSIALTRPRALVDAQTGVGDITIRDVDSGRYLVSTGVGQVYVSVANEIASLDASAGTGDIEIVLPRSETEFGVRATTGVGQRRVDVATSSQGGTPITADVGVGDVSVRYA